MMSNILRRLLLSLVLASVLPLGACSLPRADEQTPINAVIMSDGTKVYTAVGRVLGTEASVQEDMITAIDRQCGLPVELTYWQAWEQTDLFGLRHWTQFKINARCLTHPA